MVSIVKLSMENDPSFFRIKVEYSSKTFSLIIIHDESAFKGLVTPDYITKQSKDLKWSEDDYILELNKALKKLPDSNLFTYNISDDTFHIKKKIASAMKVKFCSIQLTQVDFAKSLIDMLDSTLAENQKYSEKITVLQSENETLTRGNELLHQQLQQFQEAKNSMENILYRQFLNLLNSKKQKICQLEQKLGIEIEDNDVVLETEKEAKMEIEQSDLYEVETDIDEENEPEQMTTETLKSEEAVEVPKSETVSPKSEETTDIKKPWNIKEFLNSKDSGKESGGSNVQCILNAMSFLDPSVPFVA